MEQEKNIQEIESQELLKVIENIEEIQESTLEELSNNKDEEVEENE